MSAELLGMHKIEVEVQNLIVLKKISIVYEKNLQH